MQVHSIFSECLGIHSENVMTKTTGMYRFGWMIIEHQVVRELEAWFVNTTKIHSTHLSEIPTTGSKGVHIAL